jgi:hypothetical protein
VLSVRVFSFLQVEHVDPPLLVIDGVEEPKAAYPIPVDQLQVAFQPLDVWAEMGIALQPRVDVFDNPLVVPPVFAGLQSPEKRLCLC